MWGAVGDTPGDSEGMALALSSPGRGWTTMHLSKPRKLYITKQEPHLNYQNNQACGGVGTPGDARLERRSRTRECNSAANAPRGRAAWTAGGRAGLIDFGNRSE